MDNKHTHFKLRASVSLIVAALLMGQSAIVAATPKHHAAKPAKAHKRAKTAPVAQPAEAPVAAKPAVAPVGKVAEASVLSEEARELTEPKSYVEAGVLGVTDTNWKFGQYTGLTNSGAYGIGNFDLRGGGAFDSGDATRWRATGRNIGLESREFTGEYKDQGKYKINVGYDEIYRNGQGTYTTPYLGAGGNDLSIPSNWNAPAAALNMRNLGATRLGDFNNVDLSTKRRRVDGGFSYLFSPEWEFKASFRHENRDGTKPLGAVLSVGGDKSVILPDPISQSTDQINASMNFTGEKAFGTFAYYGSIFHNDYQYLQFDNAYAAPSSTVATVGRMSQLPDNQFHQFTVNGGYNFSADTKLVGSGAYGRNWQDQSFLPSNTMSGLMLGQNNLNGAVDFKNANLKLTHKVSQDLNLAAAYKYDERENLTDVNTYRYRSVDQSGAIDTTRSNTPFSRRVQTGNLDASYSFAKGHWLKAGYEIQSIDRWCNGSWISCVDTPTTTENIGKLDYRGTFFDKLNAKLGYAYSNRSADNYNQDNAYLASYGTPSVALLPGGQNVYNQYVNGGMPAWGPFAGYVASTVPASLYNNNNPNVITPGGQVDISGLGRYNTAPRNQQKFTSLLDYQVTDKLNIGLNGDYRYDNYYQSMYGLQSSRNWSINLDGNYNFSEDFSGHLFYTYQDIMSNTVGSSYANNTDPSTTTTVTDPKTKKKVTVTTFASTAPGSVAGGCYNNVRAMQNNSKIDPCRNWDSNTSNNIDTIGLGLKQKGLFSGKLDLMGDFLYSFARTQVDVSGGQYVQSPTGAALTGPWYYIPAAPMPEVRTQLFSIKLDGKYSFNKSSAAHLTYMFQHMISNDYIYTGMSVPGTPQGVMPTNMQAPTYSVHVIGLSYIYNF